MTTASACGKIILFGEHAVVYGRPAIAVPLPGIRTRVRVQDNPSGATEIRATDLGQTFLLSAAPRDDALAVVVRAVLARVDPANIRPFVLTIKSEIPIASGLGSGAAVSTAIVRALAAHTGLALTADEISALVYETEKLYHGTPSGIDNTVIAYERAIRFARGEGPRPIRIARPFTLAIANTGIASPTRITVGDVRKGWKERPSYYEPLFDRIATVVGQAQSALETGEIARLGPLMNQNQELLEGIGVSSRRIEELVRAARAAGAAGAKLSGGGRGGNVIVALEPSQSETITAALMAAGAMSVIVTEIA